MAKRNLPAWFTGWYMDCIAGRYCPCEWPIKSRRLIRWCGWVDDENERHDLIRFAAFHITGRPTIQTTSGTSGTSTSNPARIRFWRIRHNGSKVER